MKNSNGSLGCSKRPISPWCAPKFWSPLSSTRTGATNVSLASWDALTERCDDGASAGAWPDPSGIVSAREPRAFFPSSVRAQIIALACTLPKAWGKPFSRWSCQALADLAKARHIVSRISASTIGRWLRADHIKPWQFRSWQKPTDPRFLEKAIPILRLYERAQELATVGHIVVCADEKTSIQARKATGGSRPARPGRPVLVGDRYQRKGTIQLFTALLVHTGETLARCFDRKRFREEFQPFLHMLFGSLWCKKIRVLHLILDNGPTHAPKQIKKWIKSLKLPFRVKIHWLPIHASWLDQVEIVFSHVQRHVLTPNDFEDTDEIETVLMRHFKTRNRHPKPVRWTYTVAKLRAKFAQKHQRKALALAA
jgi:hypothetical protein